MFPFLFPNPLSLLYRHRKSTLTAPDCTLYNTREAQSDVVYGVCLLTGCLELSKYQIHNLLNVGWKPSNIRHKNFRPSPSPSIMLRLPPLGSKTSWTGENRKTKRIEFLFLKKFLLLFKNYWHFFFFLSFLIFPKLKQKLTFYVRFFWIFQILFRFFYVLV